MDKLFKVVGCPNCRVIQVTSATKYLDCRVCNTRTPMSRLKVLYASKSALEAARAAKQLKLKESRPGLNCSSGLAFMRL